MIDSLFSSGERRRFRRMALGVAAVVFVVALGLVAHKVPVGTLATPWLPISLGILICLGIAVWFGLAQVNWSRTDQSKLKNVRRKPLPELVDAQAWEPPPDGVLIGVTDGNGTRRGEHTFLTWT